MVVSCRNCGCHFSESELSTRRPPVYPWRLTPLGQRTAAENYARGDARQCPECGNQTLR